MRRALLFGLPVGLAVATAKIVPEILTSDWSWLARLAVGCVAAMVTALVVYYLVRAILGGDK